MCIVTCWPSPSPKMLSLGALGAGPGTREPASTDGGSLLGGVAVVTGTSVDAVPATVVTGGATDVVDVLAVLGTTTGVVVLPGEVVVVAGGTVVDGATVVDVVVGGGAAVTVTVIDVEAGAKLTSSAGVNDAVMVADP